ncbi:unnamed protein product [Musa hybrid cultivar]
MVWINSPASFPNLLAIPQAWSQIKHQERDPGLGKIITSNSRNDSKSRFRQSKLNSWSRNSCVATLYLQ